jgi:superfamily II DNA/RNA helicase
MAKGSPKYGYCIVECRECWFNICLEGLAEDFLHDYIRINIGSLDTSANHNITQIVDVVHEVEKEYKLLQLLEDIMGGSENKTIVFIETKRKVDEITRRLRRDGWPALCIHGDKAQSEREFVLRGTKELFLRDKSTYDLRLKLNVFCSL